jgi:hypothetical protein
VLKASINQPFENDNNTISKNGDGWGMDYDIVLPPLYEYLMGNN